MEPVRDLECDRLVETGLLTCAAWHVEHGTTYDVAVTDLRSMADGRFDLLSHVAGVLMGEYANDPSRFSPCDVRTIAMLVEAGAEAAPLLAGFTLAHGDRLETRRIEARGRGRGRLSRARVVARSR